MTRTEHLLQIFSEENIEVAHRISKALRFTTEEIQPGQNLTNGDRILEEFYDAVAVLEMLQKEGKLPVWSDERVRLHKEAKVLRVEKFLILSRTNKTLTE